MGTFNLTSYASGRIVKTVTADSMEEAKTNLENKGYDCQDDNFLETAEQATELYKKSPRYAEIEQMRQDEYGDEEFYY